MKLFHHNLNKDKTLHILLTNIYGINRSRSRKICNILGFGLKLRGNQLTKEQMSSILNFFNFLDKQILLEMKLKRFRINSIQTLKTIKSYKGFRHKLGLKVNGQNTH